jgi:hypothetical protein
MNNYFEVKITFDKTLGNGKEKKVSELYLVDALSFTEAEAKITAEFAPLPNFKVKSIRQYKVAEIVNKTNLDDSRYFKCKVNFITLDERSGKEKKSAVYMLVDAETLDNAKALLVEHMKSTMSDYSIEKIEETKIMAVI